MGIDISTLSATPARAQAKRIGDGVLLARRAELTIRAWRTVARPDKARRSAAAWREALRCRGVDPSRLGRDWPSVGTGTWMVLAEEGPTLCGGICVELGEDGELPFERTLRALGVSSVEGLGRSPRSRSCEFARLWVAPTASGRGLGLALIEAGVRLARRLGLAELHVLAPDHTLHHFCSLGAEVHTDIGDRGSFAYPTADYSSWLASLRLRR